ncbi:MAG: RDD family protein [Candidatus Sulfotelmatobacter sp.]
MSPPPATEVAARNDGNEVVAEDTPAWRMEVAARLNRYQARRKPRPPRYPSLRLRFEEEDVARTACGISAEPPCFAQSIVTASHQAVALHGFVGRTADAVGIPASAPGTPSDGASQEATVLLRAAESHRPATPAMAPVSPPPTAKIIEFPRSWMPPAAPPDELAEPVLDRDRPRILEAPDLVPPPPALGGITIEPAHRPEMEKRPGIDIPLQGAPLARRVLSAAIDDVMVAAACALFGFIFCKMTVVRPPRLQMVELAAGFSGLFWAAYQYLLLVHSGTTPGLRLAGLELARFDGSRAGRRLRRWRVLASFLSAASLGMGYAWIFLDEDALCWHDRITHTYLAPAYPAPKKPEPGAESDLV